MHDQPIHPCAEICGSLSGLTISALPGPGIVKQKQVISDNLFWS
jgi:hypothetical protein